MSYKYLIKPSNWACLISLLLGFSCITPINADTINDWQLINTMRAKQLNEVSGVAINQQYPDQLWMINDSGGGNYIYAVQRTTADIINRIKIDGVVNVDWEDLARFHYQGQNWLLIADIGDNRARRQFLHLYLIKEPILNATGQYPSNIKPTADISFYYKDGPRDSEALSVDLTSQQILLISKRDDIPKLYRLPLTIQTPNQPLLAEAITTIQHLQKPTLLDTLRYGQRAQYIAQPTALDISEIDTEGHQTAALLTYKNLYLYQKLNGETWTKAFSNSPKVILLPPLIQAEALTFLSKDSILITSEQLPAPVYQLNLSINADDNNKLHQSN